MTIRLELSSSDTRGTSISPTVKAVEALGPFVPFDAFGADVRIVQVPLGAAASSSNRPLSVPPALVSVACHCAIATPLGAISSVV